MNGKSWQYFENVLLPELVTCRLDNSVWKMIERFIASVESQVLEI